MAGWLGGWRVAARGEVVEGCPAASFPPGCCQLWSVLRHTQPCTCQSQYSVPLPAGYVAKGQSEGPHAGRLLLLKGIT